MNKHLRTCGPALAAVILGMATVARAASVTWTGATNGTWDTATGNWTGGSGSLYTDGDGVTFNDSGANTNPITLSGTLGPALKTFSNTGVRFYRLDSGTLGGTSNLAVSGGGNVSFGNPAGGTGTTPPVLSFTGDTVITNGSRLGLFHQTTGGPLSLGTGTIVVNGGYFGLHNTGTGQSYSFANSLTIGSGGGTVSFNGNGATESSYMPTLTGTLRLEGNLDHAPRNTIFGTSRLGNGFNDNRGVIFTGTVEVIGADRRIRFIDSPYAGGRNPLSTMTFSGNSINLNGNTLTLDLNGTTQTAFSLSSVALNGPGALAIGVGSQYSFAGVALAGGAGVSVAAGAELRLSSGTYNSADFAWGPGAILNLGNNTGTATLNVGGGMTFGTAPGQAQTFRLAPRGGDSGFSVVINGNLTFDRGSTMEFYATDDFRDRFNAGTLRFLDGSTIGFGGTRDNMGIGNSGGSAVIAFGDGNSATAETVTIAGRSGTFVRPNGGFDVTDTGTTLRYTSTASVFRGYATSETRGTPQAINLPFLAGAAGTEFAPAAGTTYDARGPATGTVFTVSAPVKFLTATGTVRFMNSGWSNAVGTPGAVDVLAGGALMGVGTCVASTVQVAAGGTVAPGLSIGTLSITGDLTMASGSFFDVEFNGAAMDLLNVSATANLNGATLRLHDLGTTIPTAQTFTILTAGTLNGTFAGYGEGASLTYQGFTGQISYAGNQVQILNFVPEPSALALLALGGLALCRRRRT